MRLFRLRNTAEGLRLAAERAPVPSPGPHEVLVRVEAASLNYRDLLVAAGMTGARDGLVPLSDGAGRVEAVGSAVARWQSGDRVAGLFFRDWTGGRFQARYGASALGGGQTDGVLAEYVVFPETSLVAIPDGLSPQEAATLPCAGVTAWHALVDRGRLQPGETVLIQGTGGVALFALQFAVAMDARPILLSSSDEKLARAREMGAWAGVNYRRTPGWERSVLDLTGGLGADHVIELGGPDTYERSLLSVAAGGQVHQIGVLTGFGPRPDLMRLQSVNADIHGIAVGSGEHFSAMNAFIAETGIRPVIDKVFAFDDAPAAYEHLRAAGHFGKVVVSL